MHYFKRLTVLSILLLLLFFPFLGDSYILHLLILSFIWAIVASAWNLIMGYAGIFSFGQIAFFTVGAYASAMTGIWIGLSPWITLVIGGLSAAIVGFAIAFPCLRIKGLYVALVTIAFHQLLPILVKLGGNWTGGDVGLIGLPNFSVLSYNFGDSKISYYYLAYFLFLVFIYVIYRIINSKIGLGFVALRDSEEFAESLGVDRVKYNIIIFSISAFITGLMGAFYVHYLGVITPRMLEIEIFAFALIMLIIGGLGKFPGAVIGAFFVTIVYEFLSGTGLYRPLILGGLIILIIILFPQGLIGLVDHFYKGISRFTNYCLNTFKEVRQP